MYLRRAGNVVDGIAKERKNAFMMNVRVSISNLNLVYSHPSGDLQHAGKVAARPGVTGYYWCID